MLLVVSDVQWGHRRLHGKDAAAQFLQGGYDPVLCEPPEMGALEFRFQENVGFVRKFSKLGDL